MIAVLNQDLEMFREPATSLAFWGESDLFRELGLRHAETTEGWYQHAIALVEGSGDLLSDRPFQEANLDHNVLPPKLKVPTASANLETMAVRAVTVC